MKRKRRNKLLCERNRTPNRKTPNEKHNPNDMRPSCRGQVRAKTVIKNVHQFGPLSFLVIALVWLTTQVESGDHLVVFPSSNELRSGGSTHAKPSRQQQQVYFNPQPSTLSGKYQSGSQTERRLMPAGSNPIGASSYQPPILRGPLSGPRAAPSSVGRGDESQVAEWPFYKSFQTIRNNQLSNQHQSKQTTAAAAATSTTAATTRTTAQDETATESSAELSDGGAPLDSAATSQENPSTTSTPDGEPNESDTTTTETAREIDLGEMMREVRKSLATTTTTTTTTSTSTTTTTAAPSVSSSEGDKAKSNEADKRANQMLLIGSPKVHSSIQKAVDQLVELGVTRAAPSEPANNRPKAQPSVMRLNGNSQGLKSSLSLNVLLKNFGAFNLSSLDQILLKSSLNEAGGELVRSNASSKGDSSRLSINGLHRFEDKRQTTTPAEENFDAQDETTGGLGEQQASAAAAAECKIEYTMKHVNITLMNDGKSDYTCDYIIDRKLTKPPTPSRGKICKLQLLSEFFSNESHVEEAEHEGTTCFGSTHLSIGRTKFCLLESSSASGSSLDRVFNFPLEHEAFDIKLVHRRADKRLGESEATNLATKMATPGEIRLEIKPISDETCGREMTPTGAIESKSAGHENGNRVTSSATPKPVMASVRPSGVQVLERDRSQTGTLQDQTQGPAGSKPGQSFVAGSDGGRVQAATNETDKTVKVNSVAGSGNKITESKAMFRLSNGRPGAKAVCASDSIHISTIGQIETPNYPDNYTANMRCRHIIKRVSRDHCKLLLHFRDFDLAPRGEPGGQLQRQPEAELCDGDYMQIGETRYCNKYAMMGHKMYLNFTEATTSEWHDEAIALSFISDSEASGRGVLIKYQQLSCEQPAEPGSKWPPARHRSEAARTPARNVAAAIAHRHEHQHEPLSRLQTLAPPLQQPDFSLAQQKGAAAAASGNQTESAASTGGNHQVESVPRGPRSKLAPASLRESKQTAAATERLPVARASKQPPASRLQVASSSASALATGDLLLADTPTTSASTLLDESLPMASNCNQVYNEMQFLLRSPYYPRPYENNLACVYYVRRNSSRVCYLELNFLSFQLEADSDCRYDSLEVNNVRLCGSLRQETTRIYLFGEVLKAIRFKTDSSNPKAGFLIRAQQLECGLDGSILRHREPAATGQTSSSSTRANTEVVSHDNNNNNNNSSSVFEYDSPLSQANQQNDSSSTPANWREPNDRTSPSSPRELSGPTLSGRSRQLTDTSSVWPQNNNNNDNFSYNYNHSLTTTTTSAAADSSGQQQSARSCDYLLHGADITIRSPMWPESYASDELLSSCRYTILRQNFGKRNAVCQLELRFVHLRLGPGDCLDIDGVEVLCSFNARNLVKYYPFNERQTHLTLTLITASGAAKLFTGRSPATPPYQNPPSSQNYSSDLLPTLRGPFRFMILARQLECVDDFLAPQVELGDNKPLGSLSPLVGAGGQTYSNQQQQQQQLVNTTNLLYAGELPPAGSKPAGPLRPRFVNRTAGGVASLPATPISLPAPRTTPSGAFQSKTDGSRLSYDQQQPDRVVVGGGGAHNNNLEPNIQTGGGRMNVSKISSTPSGGGGVLMYSFANSIADNQNASKSVPPGATSCLLQFNQYNGILASSNILRAQAEWPLPLEAAGLRSGLQSGGECEIRLKLLPGFCKIQLSFGEFDLYPSRRPTSLCPGEYLELAGVQYCGHELRGATRILSTTLAGQRHISLRAVQASQNSFRAIFKQLECDQNQATNATTTSATATSNTKTSTALTERKSQADEGKNLIATSSLRGTQAVGSIGGSIDFREIHLREEFFELDSARLSSVPNRNLYEPNLFIVYQLKRAHANVCKLRLMFYKFDLEPAEPNRGCKRDFLDINNQDRLCGAMDFRLDEASRQYDWPEGQRDFQISFVSDGHNERAGFHLFGEQVRCNRHKPDTLDESPKGSGGKQQQMPLVKTGSPDSGGRQSELGPSEESYKVGGAPGTVKSNGLEGRKEIPVSQEKFSRRLPTNCSQIIEKNQFELTSPGWPGRYDGTGSCHYLVRRAKANICSLTLNVNSLILDIHPKASSALDTVEEEGRCSGEPGDASHEDRLDIDQSVQLCGLMTRPRSYKFHFTNSTIERQFIVIKFTSNQASGFGFLLEGQQNTCDSPGQAGGGEQQQVDPPAEDQKRQLAAKTSMVETSRPEAKQQTSDGDQTVYQISYDDTPSRVQDEAAPQVVQMAQVAQKPPEQRQQADTTKAKSCNRLLTGPFNLLESENFPDHYENDLDCVYAVRRLNQSVCAIDLVFNYFDLEPGSSSGGSQTTATLEPRGSEAARQQCDTDYLEVDYSRFCGTYPSQHKLRFHYFEHELDKILRFRSDAARTRIGFSISLSQVVEPAECRPGDGGSVRQLSPATSGDQEHRTTTTSSVRRDHQESEREVISYLSDSTSALGMAPVQGNDSSRLPSATVCSFSYQNERQLLVSPGYNPQRRHYDNNLDCQYKLVAASYEICSLRLTIIDMELERSNDCLNDYLLIDSRRYCGSLAPANSSTSSSETATMTTRPVIELEFDANLPREIHLILHTDSHTNSGRGFKLLAEQLACDAAPKATPTPPADQPDGGTPGGADQEFSLAEGARRTNSELAVAKARQLRRLRFGQLAYPKNYVSSGSSAASRPAHASSPPPQSGAEPPSGSVQAKSWRGQEVGSLQTASSDDLRLSKEIVVGRQGAQAATSRANVR